MLYIRGEIPIFMTVTSGDAPRSRGAANRRSWRNVLGIGPNDRSPDRDGLLAPALPRRLPRLPARACLSENEMRAGWRGPAHLRDRHRATPSLSRAVKPPTRTGAAAQKSVVPPLQRSPRPRAAVALWRSKRLAMPLSARSAMRSRGGVQTRPLLRRAVGGRPCSRERPAGSQRARSAQESTALARCSSRPTVAPRAPNSAGARTPLETDARRCGLRMKIRSGRCQNPNEQRGRMITNTTSRAGHSSCHGNKANWQLHVVASTYIELIINGGPAGHNTTAVSKPERTALCIDPGVSVSSELFFWPC